ncbi:hypothetical protein [Acetobacterium wieringae]|uniref:hypothetical protein n=1 Tax=Acetobacterium wieringae TaxID=52694 RepID=UPI0026E97E6B|nr:hypothetical protein [Acetobacterium wieringae]
MDEQERKRKVKEFNDLLFEVHERQGSSKNEFLKLIMGYIDFLPINFSVALILSLI